MLSDVELNDIRAAAEDNRYRTVRGSDDFEERDMRAHADQILELVRVYENRPRETSHTIERWRQDTFGTCFNADILVDRAAAEFAEFQAAETPAAQAEEAVDTIIVLLSLLGHFGVDARRAIDAKMAVNRKRQWRLNGDGTGQHVKAPA